MVYKGWMKAKFIVIIKESKIASDSELFNLVRLIFPHSVLELRLVNFFTIEILLFVVYSVSWFPVVYNQLCGVSPQNF